MGMELFASAAAFFGVLLIVLGFFQVRGRQSAALRRLETLQTYSSPGAEAALPLALLAGGGAWAARTRTQLERAGLALRLHEYVALRFFVGLLALVVVFSLGNRHALAFLGGLVVAAIAYMLPAFYVRLRIIRQVQKFNDQLEPMLTMLSNSLRAGFGLLQALDLAAEQLQPPMSTELQRVLRHTGMGASIEDALVALGQRVGSYDLDVVITAVLIQRSVGSNLSEVLDKVSHTIRERVRIKGEINTLTAQKRLSGWIVGLMPAAFVAMMLVLSWEYMSTLFTDPTGRLLLVTAIVLDILGMLTIRRIVSVDI